MKAIQEKNCKNVASLPYHKVDELGEEDLGEIPEKAGKLALECKDFELYKLVVYYYRVL